MDTDTFWQLIEDARAASADPSDGEAVAARASELLAQRPPAEILAAQQTLWDLMAVSYSTPLWGAAYLINGGCSDDGFDYFRGWLIVQGRTVFEQAVADPDSLAAVPAVGDAAPHGCLECEDALSIVWDAHESATGTGLDDAHWTIDYPDLGDDWDFDDSEATARHLPRLTELYGDG
ncbi:DUF4240 domain-containing protein [Streptomyces sp. N35]|uniref:DUF4240 domain-containing protein n=1 Tax=Streptomyces sp. N35 TaxID=2795730 RepID=UPI0018F4F25D|nr:DUF4240 domain-containing protein [Streptomyces sp. N35]